MIRVIVSAGNKAWEIKLTTITHDYVSHKGSCKIIFTCPNPEDFLQYDGPEIVFVDQDNGVVVEVNQGRNEVKLEIICGKPYVFVGKRPVLTTNIDGTLSTDVISSITDAATGKVLWKTEPTKNYSYLAKAFD